LRKGGNCDGCQAELVEALMIFSTNAGKPSINSG